MSFKIFTCKECKSWEDQGEDIGLCEIDSRYKDSITGLCPKFRTKDGKQPRFCKMAGSVDAMAELLITDGYTQDGCEGFVFIPKGKIYLSKSLAIKAAKKWLMEVE